MTDSIAPETPDAGLVLRSKGGELDAFEMLTNRYEQRVYSLALRMLRHEQDAEDVTQQTFLSALEHLNGFRGEAGFATWLLRIATVTWLFPYSILWLTTARGTIYDSPFAFFGKL